MVHHIFLFSSFSIALGEEKTYLYSFMEVLGCIN